MVYQRILRVQTSGQRDMHDVTGDVAVVVAASGIDTGTVPGE